MAEITFTMRCANIPQHCIARSDHRRTRSNGNIKRAHKDINYDVIKMLLHANIFAWFMYFIEFSMMLFLNALNSHIQATTWKCIFHVLLAKLTRTKMLHFTRFFQTVSCQAEQAQTLISLADSTLSFQHHFTLHLHIINAQWNGLM